VHERTAELREANVELQDEIEERKRVEQSLTDLSLRFAEQARVLDQILSASPQQFYLYDMRGKFIYASRAAADMLGLKQADMEAKYWWELGFPEGVMRVIDIQREKVISSGEAWTGVLEFPTARGTRQFEYILSPIRRSDGVVDTVVATARDVTDALSAATDLARSSALVEEQALYRIRALEELVEILNALPVAIIARDLDGRVTYWSEEAQRRFGWTGDEAVGKAIGDLLVVESEEPLGDIESRLMNEGSWHGAISYRTKGGAAVSDEAHWLLRLDAEGEPESVLEVLC
jgi:PAS domain S-box-containing protein